MPAIRNEDDQRRYGQRLQRRLGTHVAAGLQLIGLSRLTPHETLRRAMSEEKLSSASRAGSDAHVRFCLPTSAAMYVFVADHSLSIGHRVASDPKLWDTKIDAFLSGLQ
jgi:hypothetical protein